ncbi:hypothetical protein NCU08547 [Neurospora crassa OR74A]|uniref:Uncharacterized protein n=1 Tax=Neurospora crassa (strain ATCC 24698 / 74-OR23-1A / CBS 708.71 / DSM 1257 / FGSC 987) TaxID=367110 RepID=Q7SBK3_NEUCR|nr:hypothetical protein NCU08547 [Neurospora crassa OR74A]EAA33793.1 hypothetical protein NCU08547 [Neurospora crassa OR74A]|eukprot:XP_963029.1 hypothetical protein NCU08547 [Neurospora crassa OR74A]
MCFDRTKLYEACGHIEFRRFICNPAPTNNDSAQSDIDSDGKIYIKSRFACSEQPQHANEVERGVCGRCRKLRGQGKGAQRKSEVLEIDQYHQQPGLRISVPVSGRGHNFANTLDLLMVYVEKLDANKSKDDPEQLMIQWFLPRGGKNDNSADIEELLIVVFQNRCIDEIKHGAEPDKVDMVTADATKDWILFKSEIKEAIEECRQIREEYQTAQCQVSRMLEALDNQGEHRPVDISDQVEVLPTSIEPKKPEQPRHAKQATTHLLFSHSNTRPFSHSATKVRRDLPAAKGRVRSMIQAINGNSEASHTVTPMANTINHHRGSYHAAKLQPSVVRKKESAIQPMRPLPCPEPPTLTKSAKLKVLTQHSFHRLPPIPEEPDSKALIVANSAANTVVLRRAKAIQVRNLNAFHCPVRQPRFGLKRAVLAPPVPRHSTPPVTVPCSKFADLGRRRVSKLKWCFGT